MSKANQKRVDCFHEASHAVMAWVEGVTISKVRLVPDDEPGDYAAFTYIEFPGEEPEKWAMSSLIAHIRITLAGPEGERLGPLPVTAAERTSSKWEFEQHQLRARQYVRQFGARLVSDAEAPLLLASAEKDVKQVFQRGQVIRSVERLARELLQRGTLGGGEVDVKAGVKVGQCGGVKVSQWS